MQNIFQVFSDIEHKLKNNDLTVCADIERFVSSVDEDYRSMANDELFNIVERVYKTKQVTTDNIQYFIDIMQRIDTNKSDETLYNICMRFMRANKNNIYQILSTKIFDKCGKRTIRDKILTSMCEMALLYKDFDLITHVRYSIGGVR